MKVLIFGGNGLVGSSLYKNMKKDEFYSDIISSTRNQVNLFNFDETNNFIKNTKPDLIINAAAKVGGIVANNKDRMEFILENLKINMNIIESLIPYPKIKLINLGSSCIYPLDAPNPISEKSLMSGKLEPTNSPYSMAKLTSIEIGNALTIQHGHEVANLMPTNLYGPNDNFSEVSSHVIPGLIARMHSAKSKNLNKFEVWGTGNPRREFLHVDDLYGAIDFLIKNNHYPQLINIGSGYDISIKSLVEKIKKIIGFDGEIYFNPKIPDGNPKKLLDSSFINELGWNPKINLDNGLEETYEWFCKNI